MMSNKVEILNYRSLFAEKPCEQFESIFGYHNMIVNIINQTPQLMPGSNNFIIQFFKNRDYFWIGSEVIGPPTDLDQGSHSNKLFYYDFLNRKVQVELVDSGGNELLLEIDHIYHYANQFLDNNSHNFDNNCFQFAIKEDNNRLIYQFLFFEKL